MTLMFVGAGVLLLAALLIVSFPFFIKSNRQQQDTLTNTQIIKQRLAELEKEVDEGILSEQDKKQAIDELKIALLDENDKLEESTVSVRLPLALGAMITLSAGAVVYYQVNHVAEVKQWQSSVERLPELSRRIVVEADQSIQPQDLQEFALGIRTRLIESPEDAIGWLLLGRIHASMSNLESALDAFEKAYQLDPTHLGTLNSYSQALVMTGDESYMRRGLSLLQQLIAQTPDDINAIGMLAVAATQLGQNQLALENWVKLQQAMPESAPMRAEVDKRVAQLRASLSGVQSELTAAKGSEPSALAESKSLQTSAGEESKSTTSLQVNVELSPQLADKMPEQGFLFVFAQDAEGQSRMPAAVVKSPLSDLPVVVELSDDNAMMAGYKLSQLNRARLVARISTDGNVATSPGELQGEIVIEVVKGASSVQQIMIDKELM